MFIQSAVARVKAFLIGSALFAILASGVQLHTVWRFWDVPVEPDPVSVDEIGPEVDQLRHVAVRGGRPDIDNIGILTTTVERKGGAKSVSHETFIPLLDGRGEARAFLRFKGELKTEDLLAYDWSAPHGLIDPEVSLPGEALEMFSKAYARASDLPIVDTHYQPTTHEALVESLIVPAIILLALALFVSVAIGSYLRHRRMERLMAAPF